VTLAAAEGRTFVDTNILVYAYDVADEHRHPVASERLGQLWAHGTGVISTQVLQEFYVVATRKLAQPLPRAAAREVIADYSTWPVVPVDPTLVLSASMLEERETLSFWDALIVGAAQRAGAVRLLSEDLQHGRTIGTVTIENPFATP
jgi:predicted nucleic acid-binding protein